MGPLDLCNISETIRTQGICPVLKVRCSYCQGINVLRPSETHRSGTRGPPIFDMSSLAGLGALHTGLGHTQYQGILSVLGLPSMCSKTFKVHERESGRAIERTAKRSCAESTMKERALSAKKVETEEDVTVKIGVSYDMGWRKRGRSYVVLWGWNSDRSENRQGAKLFHKEYCVSHLRRSRKRRQAGIPTRL